MIWTTTFAMFAAFELLLTVLHAIAGSWGFCAADVLFMTLAAGVAGDTWSYRLDRAKRVNPVAFLVPDRRFHAESICWCCGEITENKSPFVAGMGPSTQHVAACAKCAAECTEGPIPRVLLCKCGWRYVLPTGLGVGASIKLTCSGCSRDGSAMLSSVEGAQS